MTSDDQRDAAERFAACAEEASETARHRALVKVAASAKALADARNWDARPTRLHLVDTPEGEDD